MAWLSDLDRQVYDELLSRFENCGEAPGPYKEQSQELLIPEPYGRDIYCHYLHSCIDRENGETGRYSQSAALYNAAYGAYQSQCLREKRAKSSGPFRLKGEMPCPGFPF